MLVLLNIKNCVTLMGFITVHHSLPQPITSPHFHFTTKFVCFPSSITISGETWTRTGGRRYRCQAVLCQTWLTGSKVMAYSTKYSSMMYKGQSPVLPGIIRYVKYLILISSVSVLLFECLVDCQIYMQM